MNFGGNDIGGGAAADNADIGGGFGADAAQFHAGDGAGGDDDGRDPVFGLRAGVGGRAVDVDIENILGGGAVDKRADGRAAVEDIAVTGSDVGGVHMGCADQSDLFADSEQ